ncbi:MAG: metal ABC transporter ATP-binding protein [Anaerolineales bacterium]|nr:metal ABC transporter ATP-binding protein [Anaerolineales bacterium]
MTTQLLDAAAPLAAPHGHAALELTNISANYGKGQPVLEDIGFSVRHGERVAVVGPNGAGKSTLFKVIVGLLPHLTGDVQVHGHSHHAGDCPAIGYVPQREAVNWKFPLSASDVVLMGTLRAVGWLRRPGKAARAAAAQALDQVGLAHLAQQPIADLSGGQQQRVFIARALAQRADVLLLDEPFSGVDAEAQEQILELLEGLRARRVTVVLSTHDLQLAATRFDRLLLLNHRLMADGPASAVLRPELLRAAYGGRLVVWAPGSDPTGAPLTVSTDDGGN